MTSTTLYYQDDRSDKVYQVAINPTAGGYTVDFAYGRRGSALKAGSKTKDPVPLEKAESIYNKLVKSKISKGYYEGVSTTSYSPPQGENQHSGIKLQLLNSISESEALRLCQDDHYCLQEKFDGERRAVKRDVNEVHGINKKGLFTSLADPIANHARSTRINNFVIDGEAMGDTLYAFDVLECDAEDCRDWPYEERYTRLQDLIADHGAIVVVKTAFSTEDKLALFKNVCDGEREGVVFKRKDAVFSAGRPNSGGDQLKYKFVETCSAIVSKHNEGKRSVAVSAIDDGWCVPLGNVTIPPNQDIPPINAVIEVRYLYAFPSHKLAQPVFLNIRNDVEPQECTIAQLKYKPQIAA